MFYNVIDTLYLLYVIGGVLTVGGILGFIAVNYASDIYYHCKRKENPLRKLLDG